MSGGAVRSAAHDQEPMSDPDQPRLPASAPSIAPPPPFRDRRVAHRRTDDRRAGQERALLARALDVLAADGDAETRLAGLLDLLARTARAERAAVLADGPGRRSAVAIDGPEDTAAALELTAWLDAATRRSRVDRAASGPAPVSLVVRSAAARPGRPDAVGDAAEPRLGDHAESASRATDSPDGIVVDGSSGRWYALLPVPSSGRVFLGFEFLRPDGPARLAERLPPELARHAAVALALVTGQLATERELAGLRAQERERTRFVSTVAHELRTPLTGVGGYLELILDGKVDDPAVERDFLERSRAIVESMGELVGDLLELSRLESGTLALEIAPFSVAEAVSRVAAGLEPIAMERGTRLATSLPPRLRSATGDRRRVEQILTNLAANALKFTPGGGTVEIVGRFDGAVAIFVVRDDGPGIDVGDRRRIFERFQRLAAHDRITGTGLGLPIARDLARRMSGEIDVASISGAGSAFILVLPGPAAVEAGVVAEALARALEEETVRLEESAVLRAIGRSRSHDPARHGVIAPAGQPRTSADPTGPHRLSTSSGAAGGFVDNPVDAPRPAD
jgi:signal transduction histidine kinase